ncbi:MAG: hypothetical protein EBV82_03785, partial [Chitinophagia bacterium]|nr:hypothetical protein [Chitinophagia bacterium]
SPAISAAALAGSGVRRTSKAPVAVCEDMDFSEGAARQRVVARNKTAPTWRLVRWGRMRSPGWRAVFKNSFAKSGQAEIPRNYCFDDLGTENNLKYESSKIAK